MFWGAVLRMMEALLSAAPTILCGLFVVGIINRLLGYAGTRRLFGTGRWRALPQAWGLGMLLPVCSLGVIPVCRELRRTGLTGGVLLAFGLSAPLFNPLSLLYGLTLAKPFAIFAFAGCSLVVLTFVGGMWDRLLPTDSMSEAEPRRVAPGIRRMLAVGVSVCREAASPTMIYILIGLLGMAALGAWLPFGSLQTALNSGDLQAPLLMLGVGLPAYVTPMNAMMQIGSMFHHGNSIGAAFVLLTIGAGTNLGLLAWVVVNYGVRRTAGWIGLVIGVVLVLAYLIEHPLVDMTAINQAHVEEHPHTHAFDMYCQPFPQEMEVDAGFVLEKLKSQALPHELTCLSLVGALLIAGSGLRVIERRFSLNDWLERVANDDAPRQRTFGAVLYPLPCWGEPLWQALSDSAWSDVMVTIRRPPVHSRNCE